MAGTYITWAWMVGMVMGILPSPAWAKPSPTNPPAVAPEPHPTKWTPSSNPPAAGQGKWTVSGADPFLQMHLHQSNTVVIGTLSDLVETAPDPRWNFMRECRVRLAVERWVKGSAKEAVIELVYPSDRPDFKGPHPAIALPAYSFKAGQKGIWLLQWEPSKKAYRPYAPYGAYYPPENIDHADRWIKAQPTGSPRPPRDGPEPKDRLAGITGWSWTGSRAPRASGKSGQDRSPRPPDSKAGISFGS